MTVIDKFAGPGGWDLAARALGIDPLGIEWDDAACATRHAAGLRTLQADVAALNPADFAPVTGLIGSPPCTAFSMAGAGEGRNAIDVYLEAILRWWTKDEAPDYAVLDEACGDPSAHLVLEPLRWARATSPEWIALEQVPTVLPVWEAIGTALSVEYHVWTGLLSAERFGVPQTRTRAFLLARKKKYGPFDPPAPTHQRYVAPRVKEKQEESLFDLPEPERIVLPEDEGLLPWVSMAQALGWDSEDLVGFQRRNDLDDGGEYRERDLREASEPAFGLTEKARSWDRRAFRATNERPNAATRDQDEPAPTLAFGHNPPRWVDTRPATTVMGDPRVIAPGHKVNESDREAGRDAIGRMEGSVRVTVAEAAVLQSFPADYPFQGTRTKQFQAVGNAVPPLLALAVLRAVVPTSGIATRFWPKVRTAGFGDCWEWQAARSENGYGVMRPDGERTGPTVKAHRVAWEIAHGPIPDGACVLHACDNPGCVNVLHLFLGTQADNVADMHEKGRGNVGAVNGATRLTEDDVRDIRARVAAGEPQSALCEEYGLTKGPMSAIVNRRTWRHV